MAYISRILASRGIMLPNPEQLYTDTPIRRRRRLGRAELYRQEAIHALAGYRQNVARREDEGYDRVGEMLAEIQAIPIEALRRAIRSPKARRRAAQQRG